MGKDLSELASYFRPLAEELLANCGGAGIPCVIVDTGRTPAEQEQKLAQKVSWTQSSKHLPQPPENLSEAIDIVPVAILKENRSDWDPGSHLWCEIGAQGVSLGLTWGGSWPHHPDPSHFEYNKENQSGKV